MQYAYINIIPYMFFLLQMRSIWRRCHLKWAAMRQDKDDAGQALIGPTVGKHEYHKIKMKMKPLSLPL